MLTGSIQRLGFLGKDFSPVSTGLSLVELFISPCRFVQSCSPLPQSVFQGAFSIAWYYINMKLDWSLNTRNVFVSHLKKNFFFKVFGWAENSQARDQTYTIAVTRATVGTTPDPLTAGTPCKPFLQVWSYLKLVSWNKVLGLKIASKSIFLGQKPSLLNEWR